ncbi:MAG: chromate efflux transporter [Candidatus Latescibacteria bacterium]|nr:chromate efflux transporter [Candidatus Latescibacterota bacterium]
MTEKKQFVRLKELILTFLKIGLVGFGGGIGTLALLRKYIVLDKKWITDDDLAFAVTLGQIIPGPFIPKYVAYIGYRLRMVKGLLVAMAAFLLPGVCAMIVLSYLYFNAGQTVAFNDILLWVQPVIIGILAWASYDMGKIYWKHGKSIAIGILAFFGSFFNVSPIITILVCGCLGMIFFSRINRLLSVVPLCFLFGASLLSIDGKGLLSVILLFIQIGTVIFGGGFAAIPFIAKEVTILRPWLTNPELLTGIALSQLTPGPVALLATFVGYKISGIIGAILATIAIFLPSTIILILILILYQYVKKSGMPRFYQYAIGFIEGIKPAIVGILIAATIVMASASGVLITDSIIWSISKIFLVGVSFVLLVRWDVSPALLILGSAVLGFILTRVFIF